MTTITGEIDKIERNIEKNEERLETINRLRRLKDMSDDEWALLKEEKKTLEQQLKSQKEELKGLRWENRKSTFFSALILGLVYAAYHFFFASSSQEQSPR